MSTTLVKVQHKGAVIIPTRLRTQAGIEEGDVMEASFQDGKIIFVPKVLIDRSSISSTDSDYTPAQRRVVDARLAEAEEDIKHGRVHGPFTTHEAMMAHLNHEVVKKGSAKKVSRNKK